MKHGWEYKKIKDVCTKRSSNLQQNKIVELAGDYPVFGASGYVQNIDTFQQEKPYIGIVKDGSGVGRVNTYPAKSSLLGTMQYIIPNNNINLGYVAYCLQSLKLSKFASGAAIPHIYFRDYGETYIPVPPLPVQEQICSLLDKLSLVIEKKKEQLKELDNLAQSIFYDMFGDPVTNEKGWTYFTLDYFIQNNYITYHLDGNHGGLYPRSEEFIDSGVPYIGANCIVDGLIDFKMSKYLSPERANVLRKGIAKNRDVLFAHNATVGPVAILNTTEDKVILSTSLTAFRCNEKFILPHFLKHYMRSSWFVAQYTKNMKQATRNQVPISQQRKMLFILPPLPLQQSFAEKIEAIEHQKELINQSIREVQTLFDSRMDYYFGD